MGIFKIARSFEWVIFKKKNKYFEKWQDFYKVLLKNW